LHRLFPLDQPLPHHLDGDPHRRAPRALAAPALEHPELPALDGELDVLHLPVVPLEDFLRPHQLAVLAGHLPRELFYGEGGPDPRHHVLSLGVQEVLAVELLLTGRGVACERHAGSGIVSEVAEDHRLHVDRRAPFVGYLVHASVRDRARVVPRAEHRADGRPELRARILRKRLARAAEDEILEKPDEPPEIADREVAVLLDPPRALQLIENHLEGILMILRFGLQPQHDVAVHLHEPAIAVVGEAFVSRLRDEPLHRLVREAEVENRVHHPRHARARAGTDRDEKRVRGGAELGAHDLLDPREGGLQGGLELARIGVPVLVEVEADGGRDRESGRHGEPEADHFGQVRALAAEEILHLRVSLGLSGAEGIDEP
jgi:hypothetical protein